MAKATSPYLSEVRGSISKRLTFRKLKPYDTQLIQSIPVPSYRRTPAQDRQRTKFLACKNIWNQMDNSQKEQYRSIAEQLSLTPYQSFVSKCLSELILYDVLIDNTQNPNDLINFQVLLEVNNDQQFFRDCNYNKNAISFMTEDLKDPVPYYIEYWNPDTKSARIWLKVPLIKGGEVTTVKLLIVPSKTTSESDPNTVFDFFDDFNDLSKWTQVRDGSSYIVVANGLLEIHSDGSNRAYARSNQQFSAPYILEVRARKVENIEISIHWDGQYGGTYDEIHSGYYAPWYISWGSPPYFVINKHVNGSETDLAKYNYNLDNNFHVYTIVAKTDGIDVYLDNSKILSTTDTTFTSGYIGLGGREWPAGIVAYYDYVRVRKYTSPEPTVTYRRL